MLTGKSLTDMAKELERIQEQKQDFIVPTKELEAKVGDNQQVNIAFETNEGEHSFGLNSHSSQQVASYLDIPVRYFHKLQQENPILLTDNINHGLENKGQIVKRGNKPEGRMIRSLDGYLRGFLSSYYRPLDSHKLLETALPVIFENGMEVVSSENTERRLFVKALSPKLKTEIQKGDTVQYGLTISNSDVGSGSLRIEPMIYRLVCDNGMISNTAMKRFHTGRNQVEREVFEVLSDETLQKDDAVFWDKVQDILKASMEQVNFEREVERLKEATEIPIENTKLDKVVDKAMKATKVQGENKKEGILAALASGNEGAGLTKYGLVNSFTKAAHQVEEISYEDSIEMERAGGMILDLNKSQWKEIAEKSA